MLAVERPRQRCSLWDLSWRRSESGSVCGFRQMWSLLVLSCLKAGGKARHSSSWDTR